MEGIRGWRSRSRAVARSCRCLRATATWASSSRARRARTPSSAPCAPLMPACGSGSSRLCPNGWARASVGHRARPVDLDLRAGPPAVACRLARCGAAPCRARGPLPGFERAALGSRCTGVGRRRSASRCRCTPPCAWRSTRAAESAASTPSCRSASTASMRRPAASWSSGARAPRDRRRIRAGARGLGERAGGPAPRRPAAERPIIHLQRGSFELPARELLPDSSVTPAWQGTARSAWSGTWRPATAACIAAGTVLSPPSTTGASASCRRRSSCATSSAWWSMGARHITFGDPDFLNGRRHSLAIVRALHERFPELTFDCTTKVEHVLEHTEVWEEMAACGCLFVVSALECVNDDILARLDKGHTTAQAVRAIDLLREHGIETRPSFMPFTPGPPRATCWTSWTSSPRTTWSPTSTRCSTRSGCWSRGLAAAGARRPARAPRPVRRRAPQLHLAVTPTQPRTGSRAASPRWSSRAPPRRNRPAWRSRASARRCVRQPASAHAPEPEAFPIGSTEGRPRLTEPWFC